MNQPAQSLRGAIEFRFVEIAAADHGLISPVALSMATSAACAPESCSQAHMRYAVGAEPLDLHVAEVAGLEDVLDLFPGPGGVLLGERGAVAGELDRGEIRERQQSPARADTVASGSSSHSG